jgi:hypothetical protein
MKMQEFGWDPVVDTAVRINLLSTIFGWNESLYLEI